MQSGDSYISNKLRATKPRFAPCLIIPIYNHTDEFSRIFPKLRELNIPTLIIDDGSTQDHFKALEALIVPETSWVTLSHSTHNQGKGAAVCQGLTLAKKKGFTHALQIDADGQHLLDDIPQFLALSQQNPSAIITAVRIYKNAPKSRIYGRKITDFWVKVNTLSGVIDDSMCGFRVYPVTETTAKVSLETVCKRMDFDTDILVKLYWAGIKVMQLKTLVTYDVNIASHFDAISDNIRISWMHTKLFFGMLIRIPQLLKIRKQYATKSRTGS